MRFKETSTTFEQDRQVCGGYVGWSLVGRFAGRWLVGLFAGSVGAGSVVSASLAFDYFRFF